ncbi:MAG: hypothetical protein ACTJHC_02215 [Vagococcus sp.]
MTYFNELQHQEKSIMLFGTSHAILAILVLADEVTESIANAISILHDSGIEYTIMLSDDHH